MPGRWLERGGVLVGLALCLLVFGTAPVVLAASAPSITGTVTDNSASPVPLAGICVVVRPQAGGSPVGHAKTVANGTYAVPTLAAGSYTVEFIGCPSPYWVTQYYNDQYSLGSATAVIVVTGVTTTGINAQMVPGGQITGTVTDNSPSPVPLANICVTATFGGDKLGPPSAPASSSLPTSFATNTNVSGNYSINGVPAGPYNMGFTDCHAHRYVVISAVRFIQVNAGSTTASVNATMALPGEITGTVTNGSTPLKGICVEIPFTAFGNTNLTGAYTLKNLTPGNYVVGFTDCQHHKYLPQWWDGQPTQQTATTIVVSSGATTANINATLAVGGSISGKVTNNTKPYTPVVGMCVNAVPDPYNAYGTFGNATTNATGNYTMKDLATGGYTVSFNSCGLPGWAFQNYPGNPVQVFAPNTTTKINARLVPQ
jgi:hypothetical protein